ncbi:MAG: hypothetical protein WCP86_06650 [bacterium]
MSGRSGIPVSTAGEHFVAYKLSTLGYLVAITRQGDLLVGDMDANDIAAVHVTTSCSAWREYRKHPENNHLEWPVCPKDALTGDNVFCAFVDLKSGGGTPDVFIVPSTDVATYVTAGRATMGTFRLMHAAKNKYLEAWHFIADQLNPRKLTVLVGAPQRCHHK